MTSLYNWFSQPQAPENILHDSSLHLPTRALVRLTNHSAAVLKQNYTAPQFSNKHSAGYILVSAHPQRIALKSDEIAIYKASQKAIEELWNQYASTVVPHKPLVSKSQLQKVLSAVLDEVRVKNTQQFVLHHDNPTVYSVNPGNDFFQGTIDRRIYFELLRQVEDTEETVFITTTSNQIISVELNTDKTFPRITVSHSTKRAEKTTQINRRVLLVDDDPHFAAIVTRVLSREGYTVLHYLNANKALSFLDSSTTNNQPSLIISDYHMPQMNGGVLCAKIREKGIKAPLIMLTSNESKELEAELIEYNIDAFIRKQEDAQILLAWCNNLSRAV